MKNILLAGASALMLALPAAALADEGMWLPSQTGAIADEMKAAGIWVFAGGLLPSDVAPVTPMHPQAVSEEVAVAVVPAGRESTAGTGRSQREDIFFGQ